MYPKPGRRGARVPPADADLGILTGCPTSRTSSPPTPSANAPWDRLRRGASEGRLTVEELDERCARAYAARTHGELEALLGDLPGVVDARRGACDARSPSSRRDQLIAVVRPIHVDLHLLDAALAGDGALARALGHAVVPGWATFTTALQRTRDALAVDPGGAAWGARLFVAGDPPELVGWGGFKGPPDADGVVELGYEIAEARRGRGLATAAARAMLAEAFADERVTTVIARTLPDRNASHRVLEKAGFRSDGTAQDGEAIWRFSP